MEKEGRDILESTYEQRAVTEIVARSFDRTVKVHIFRIARIVSRLASLEIQIQHATSRVPAVLSLSIR